MKPIETTLTKGILNHLCEAYLSWTLYTSDFVDLLWVNKLSDWALWKFIDKFNNFYEQSMELKRADKHWHYNEIDQWEKFADYLLNVLEEVKAGEISIADIIKKK